MKLRKIMLVPALCSMLALSNKSFSQENPDDEIGKTGFYPGCEIGYVMNRFIDRKIADLNSNTGGITFGIYVHNDRLQLGYIAEINRKDKPMSPGNGIDLGEVGIEFEYFPTRGEKIKPYVGSELKYEGETLFVGKENTSYKQNGIGLELKCGTEFKPLKNRKIRGYLDLGYNLSLSKKSKGYPENPEVVRDKFLIAAGIKF
jgi:hypothetical protein